jgi:TonB family protein
MLPDSASLVSTRFPWRRVLAALWFSAAVHLALMGLIKFRPMSPAHESVDSLQVRLEGFNSEKSAEQSPPKDVATLAEQAVANAAKKPSPEKQAARQQTEAETGPATVQTPAPADKSHSLPQIELPQWVDRAYYAVLELDSPNLQPIQPIEPTDPQAGQPHPLSGYVRLLIKLEADGTVNEATVVESNLPQSYQQSALEAFGKAHFVPARKDGQPVRARFMVQLEFGQRDGSIESR